MSSAWFPSVGAVLHWFQTPANSAHSKTVPSSPQQPSVPRGADVWVFVTEDVSPLNKKEGDTFDKIEKWAPQLFIAFAATCCFFGATRAFILGIGFAAYQKKYPDQLSTTIDQLAQSFFPLKGKKFGRISVLIENPETTMAAIALASMWSSNFAQMGAVAYFTYRVTTVILSIQPNEIKQDPKT